MTVAGRIVNSRILFCLLLALPALPMAAGLLGGALRYHGLLHPTGEFAARFMILALMVTPIRVIFPHRRWAMWLQHRRRYLGVAAFCYAAAHTVLYVIDRSLLPTMLEEAVKPPYLAGWAAMALLVPLAATSNDWSVHRLGPAWKSLQRIAYVAAILTLLHWLLITRGPGSAIVHFAPLALLEAWRIAHHFMPRRHKRMTAAS